MSDRALCPRDTKHSRRKYYGRGVKAHLPTTYRLD